MTPKTTVLQGELAVVVHAVRTVPRDEAAETSWPVKEEVGRLLQRQ